MLKGLTIGIVAFLVIALAVTFHFVPISSKAVSVPQSNVILNCPAYIPAPPVQKYRVISNGTKPFNSDDSKLFIEAEGCGAGHVEFKLYLF